MIVINNLRVRSDNFQWVIEKKYIKAKDREVYYIPETYHPNLKRVSLALMERDLRDQDYVTLEKILERLEEMKDGINIEVVNEYSRED